MALDTTVGWASALITMNLTAPSMVAGVLTIGWGRLAVVNIAQIMVVAAQQLRTRTDPRRQPIRCRLYRLARGQVVQDRIKVKHGRYADIVSIVLTIDTIKYALGPNNHRE